MTEYRGTSHDASRVMLLEKKRQEERAEFERRRQQLEADNARRAFTISEKFTTTASSVEEALKNETVGLVTKEEYAKRRQAIERELESQAAANAAAAATNGAAAASASAAKPKKVERARLSFMEDGDADGDAAEEAVAVPKKKSKKNPNVDTSFLPDREREEQLQSVRSQLAAEFESMQERIKNEPLVVTYSYWDGTGHRRTARIRKGYTIREFLQVVQKDFSELSRVSADNLMFIKEDLIIPHHYSFYYLIVNKARGKSGPLFQFDVHDDIRMVNAASLEKEDSHPAKVVDRRWYERNKHVFPASRWEVYDPDKTFDTYTVHGHEVNAKK